VARKARCFVKRADEAEQPVGTANTPIHNAGGVPLRSSLLFSKSTFANSHQRHKPSPNSHAFIFWKSVLQETDEFEAYQIPVDRARLGQTEADNVNPSDHDDSRTWVAALFLIEQIDPGYSCRQYRRRNQNRPWKIDAHSNAPELGNNRASDDC